MIPDVALREAWSRSEALCECRTAAHGHPGRCGQFLLWAERGGTGKGAWDVRQLKDPRRPGWEILCAACYTAAMGRLPQGP